MRTELATLAGALLPAVTPDGAAVVPDVAWLWLAIVVALPLVAIAATLVTSSVERQWRAVTALASLSTIVAALPLVAPPLARFRVVVGAIGDAAVVRVDALSAPLPTLAALLWLITLALAPRSTIDARSLRRDALATALTTVTYLSEHPLVLVGTWTITALAFTRALREVSVSRARTVTTGYVLASTGAFVLGVGLVAVSAAPSSWMGASGLALIVVAALVRKGIFPFHAWMPTAFAHTRLDASVLFCAPQLGTYAVAVLVVPQAPDVVLRVIAVFALVTAAHGASQALVQRSARRALGYLFMSQSALVLAGLDGGNADAVAGALVVWLSSSVAFAGFARALEALEVRRGPLDLQRFHGEYARSPMLAVTLLVLGLTLTGFPGTLGFVGEELLVGGALTAYPTLGALVVVSGAFTGLAVLRMYFSLFAGRPGPRLALDLRAREVVGFALLIALLVGGGLLPARIVDGRVLAGAALVEARSARAP